MRRRVRVCPTECDVKPPPLIGAWSSWSRYVVDRTTMGALPAQDGVAFFPRVYEAALPDARQSDVLSIAVTPVAAR